MIFVFAIIIFFLIWLCCYDALLHRRMMKDQAAWLKHYEEVICGGRKQGDNS